MADHADSRGAWSNQDPEQPTRQSIPPYINERMDNPLVEQQDEDEEAALERQIQQLKLKQAALSSKRRVPSVSPNIPRKDEEYKYYQGQRLASNVFSPGYGFRSHNPEADHLPPPEDLVGPNGSVHRVYPATSPIRPPTNGDQGWEDAPLPPSPIKSTIAIMSATVSVRSSVPTPEPNLREITLQQPAPISPPRSIPQSPIRGHGDLDVQLERDPPPHRRDGLPRRREGSAAVTTDSASAASARSAAYVAWPSQGVEVDDSAKDAMDELYRRFGLKTSNSPDRSLGFPDRGPNPPVPRPTMGPGRGFDKADMSVFESRRSGPPGPRASWGDKSPTKPTARDDGWGGGQAKEDAGRWGKYDGETADGGWGGAPRASAPRPTEDSWGAGDASNRGGYGSGRGDGCHKCGEQGHFARECLNGSQDKCYNCQQVGHMSRDCPEPQRPAGACHNCGQTGHQARACTEPKQVGAFRGNCYKCGEQGHSASRCPGESGVGGYDNATSGGYNSYQGEQSSRQQQAPPQDSWGSSDADGWGETPTAAAPPPVQVARDPAPKRVTESEPGLNRFAEAPRPAPAIHPSRLAQVDANPKPSQRAYPAPEADRPPNDGKPRDNGWGARAQRPAEGGGQGWNNAAPRPSAEGGGMRGWGERGASGRNQGWDGQRAGDGGRGGGGGRSDGGGNDFGRGEEAPRQAERMMDRAPPSARPEPIPEPEPVAADDPYGGW